MKKIEHDENTAKKTMETSPAREIESRIRRSMLSSCDANHGPIRPHDAVSIFADVIKMNAIYLVEHIGPEADPVVESLVDISAKLKRWISVT